MCVCSGRYLGNDRKGLEPVAQGWLDWAQAGNKQAQFEFGLRYAKGDGVPQDCDIARKLLRLASANRRYDLGLFTPSCPKRLRTCHSDR